MSRIAKQGQCCLCGAPYNEYGHNPEPVRDKGRACEWCNTNLVIPLRIKRMVVGVNPKPPKIKIKQANN